MPFTRRNRPKGSPLIQRHWAEGELAAHLTHGLNLPCMRALGTQERDHLTRAMIGQIGVITDFHPEFRENAAIADLPTV